MVNFPKFCFEWYTQEMNEILTVAEAGKFLKKHPETIRRWIEAKRLPAKKLASGKYGIYAILRNDLLELAVKETLEKKSREVKPHHPLIPTIQTHLPI